MVSVANRRENREGRGPGYRIRVAGLLILLSVTLAGCGGGGSSSAPTTGGNNGGVSNPAPEIAGSWRIYSEYLYYLEGGSQIITPVTTTLALNSDGAWTFGSSSGTWSVSAITSSDWTQWGISSYGPTRKLVLTNWNNGTSTGPIDESNGQVDFVWVIYPATDISSPGTVWMKFGH